MKSSRSKSIVKKLILITAALGITYQIYRQTYRYLLYQSYSNIALVPVNTRLPAIAMCIAHEFSQMAFNPKFIPPAVFNASLKMPSDDAVVNSCYVTLPNTTTTSCKSISRAHRFMNHQLICLSFFEEKTTYLPEEQLMYTPKLRKINHTDEPMLRVTFNKSPLSFDYTTIVIRHPDEPLISIRSSESSVLVDSKTHGKISLEYEMMKMIQLPAPHGSCRQYTRPLDVDSSMVKCWGDNFVDHTKTHQWPYFVFYDFDKNYSSEEKCRKWLPKAENDRAFTPVNLACSKINSQVDCERTYLILRKKAQHKKRDESDKLIVEIPQPPTDQLTITNCAMTTIDQLLNDIGGILSMWVGFSIYLTSVRVGAVIKRLAIDREKKRRTSRTQRNVSKCKRKETKRSRILLCVNNLVIKLLGWMTTIYFVIQIMLIYFEKPFATSVVATVPDRLKMLKLTVCFDMRIDPKKVEKFFPDVYDSVPVEKWPQVLTIEQIFKTTLDWSEVYAASSIYLSPGGGYVPVSKHFNFTKSITGRSTCFTTFGEKEYLLDGPIEEHMLASISHATSVFVNLQTEKLQQLNQTAIHAHFNEDGLVSDDFSSPDRVTVPGTQDERLYHSGLIIRAYRTILELYPNHRSSICINYKNVFNQTRRAVFDRCLFKKFISKYRVWPMGSQIWQNSVNGDIHAMQQTQLKQLKFYNNSMVNIFHAVSESCEKFISRPDCDNLIIKVVVRDHFYRSDSTMKIILYPPSKQFFTYRQELIYTVVDILGYIGGTINTWVGLSFLDIQFLVPTVQRCVNILFARRNGPRYINVRLMTQMDYR